MRDANHLESPGELFAQLREATAKRRLLLFTGPVVVGALVVYHFALFWDRVVSQTLFEPGVALRWLLTVALIWLAWRFRAAGVPLFRGRKALVFWLLVALLHMSFAGPLAEDGLAVTFESASTVFLFVLPASAAAALVLALLIWTAFGGTRPVAPGGAFRRSTEEPSSRFVLEAGFMPSLSRRPPPA